MAHQSWSDIKREHLTPDRLKRVKKEVEVASQAIKLRELREMLNKTQVELAEALGKTQESLSKSENRPDWLVSTLIDYVEGLGGKLRVFAEIDGAMYPLTLVDRSPRTGPSLRGKSAEATARQRKSSTAKSRKRAA